jgi:hypothetical protein
VVGICLLIGIFGPFSASPATCLEQLKGGTGGIANLREVRKLLNAATKSELAAEPQAGCPSLILPCYIHGIGQLSMSRASSSARNHIHPIQANIPHLHCANASSQVFASYIG